jgi:hypothetical protein
LRQGLALAPLTDELHDEILECFEPSGHSGFPEFWKLSPSLIAFARRQSEATPLVYLETDYFGGNGTQAAIAWARGHVVFGPEQTGNAVPLSGGAINRALRTLSVKLLPTRPINCALQFLGVKALWPFDEFDAVGLGRCRSNEDWIEQAESTPRG